MEKQAELADPAGFRMGNIILAAPDVDRDAFRLLAPRSVALTGRKMNLYASHHDQAVSVSKWIHGYPRAGFHPPITLVPGAHTVDVTRGDISGHSFYGEERRVLYDITQVLDFNAEPNDSRRRLFKAGGGTHWQLR
jgi:esterase/lipase superfamily enzyme